MLIRNDNLLVIRRRNSRNKTVYTSITEKRVTIRGNIIKRKGIGLNLGLPKGIN